MRLSDPLVHAALNRAPVSRSSAIAGHPIIQFRPWDQPKTAVVFVHTPIDWPSVSRLAKASAAAVF